MRISFFAIKSDQQASKILGSSSPQAKHTHFRDLMFTPFHNESPSRIRHVDIRSAHRANKSPSLSSVKGQSNGGHLTPEAPRTMCSVSSESSGAPAGWQVQRVNGSPTPLNLRPGDLVFSVPSHPSLVAKAIALRCWSDTVHVAIATGNGDETWDVAPGSGLAIDTLSPIKDYVIVSPKSGNVREQIANTARKAFERRPANGRSRYGKYDYGGTAAYFFLSNCWRTSSENAHANLGNTQKYSCSSFTAMVLEDVRRQLHDSVLSERLRTPHLSPSELRHILEHDPNWEVRRVSRGRF